MSPLIIASPNVGNVGSQLTSVAAVTASSIWSVGYYFTPVYATRTLVEYWNGSAWKLVASPDNGTDINQLNGVAAVSANDVWAVGYYRNGHFRTLIEHWDGTQWGIITSPNVGTDFCLLYGIAAISANDVWAVGEDMHVPPHYTLTERWNGTQWNIVSSPDPSTTFNSLDALIAVSGNLWAVGYYYDTQNKTYQTLVELYR